MEEDEDIKIYTTKTGAELLGYKQDTLKCYAIKYGIGMQPGGPGTPYLFSLEQLRELRAEVKKGHGRWSKTQLGEDRIGLGVGPMYGPDWRPGD